MFASCQAVIGNENKLNPDIVVEHLAIADKLQAITCIFVIGRNVD